jgi:chromosome segregation ATPase
MLAILIEYWEIVTLPIVALITWLVRGRHADKQALKRGEVEIKTAEIETKVSEANYTQNVQDIYKDLAIDLKADREFLKEENTRIREESKSEKEYFRKELDEIRKQSASIQSQLNEITLSYAKEVEISQNWEKLHSELKAKFLVLENEYEHLKKAHEKLKGDFDKYKKDNK